MSTAANQSFGAHLRELRRRLFACVAVVIIGVAVGYTYREQLITWLQSPLNAPLYYTSPTGSLQFLFQVCLMVGIVVALPVIVYNILGFMAPALRRKHSVRTRLSIVASSCFLAGLGIAFAYVVVLPAALHFFAHLDIGSVQPLISTNEYFSFAAGLLATFAILFQLPLIMLGINTIKPLPPKKLLRYQKFVIVASFGVALVLPFAYDPITQLYIAMPLIGLYEISVLLVWWANRPRSANRQRHQIAAAADRQRIEQELAAFREEEPVEELAPIMPQIHHHAQRVDQHRPVQLG